MPWHACDGGSTTCFVHLSSPKMDASSRKTKLAFLQRADIPLPGAAVLIFSSCAHHLPQGWQNVQKLAAARPNFRKASNECRLHTVGQKVQLLEEKEEKVIAGAVIGVLKAGLLNFPPSFLCKSGLMTSLHLSAGVSRMALIPNSVLVTHRCIYSSSSPCPAPSDNPLL